MSDMVGDGLAGPSAYVQSDSGMIKHLVKHGRTSCDVDPPLKFRPATAGDYQLQRTRAFKSRGFVRLIFQRSPYIDASSLSSEILFSRFHIRRQANPSIVVSTRPKQTRVNRATN